MESSLRSAEFVSSSKVRLELLLHLATGPKSPSELATIEKKHISHVSRAIRELEVRGLVEVQRRESKGKYYSATLQGNAIALVLARIPR